MEHAPQLVSMSFVAILIEARQSYVLCLFSRDLPNKSNVN
jgi:hypothetical protein